MASDHSTLPLFADLFGIAAGPEPGPALAEAAAPVHIGVAIAADPDGQAPVRSPARGIGRDRYGEETDDLERPRPGRCVPCDRPRWRTFRR